MSERVFQSAKRACYSGLDSVALRRELAARLKPAIPFDSYAFGTTDPDTGLLTHLVAASVPEAMTLAFIDRLYPFESARYAMDSARRGRTVYDTGEESAEIRAALRANGYAHGSHAVFGARDRLWGKWCILQGSASSAELARTHALLRRLAPHITHGLRHGSLVEASGLRGGGSSGVRAGSAAGVVVLNAAGRIVLRTESAVPMLADLRDVGVTFPDAVPLSLISATSRLRYALRSGAPDAPNAVSLRARGLSGRWYGVEASLAEPEAHGADAAVVVLRQFLPREIASMLTDLYGLSMREREVVAAVARGLTTKEIAAQLQVSPHTVKEHLDRACEKTGARGRKALVARIFFDAYVPNFGVTHEVA